MSASDSDGNGFSVALPQPEAKRLAQALRLPDPPSGVVFACGSWNGKIYELDLATTFWESATCVSITVIKLPDLLRWLLREKKRFCTELKAWGAGDILLDSPPRVFLGGKGRKY